MSENETSSDAKDFVNTSAAFDESCSEGDPWIVTLVSQDDTIRLDTRLDEELMKSIAERGNGKMEGAIERARWRNGAQAAGMARAVYKLETLACIAKDEENFDDNSMRALQTNIKCDAVSSPGGFCLMVSNQIHLLSANCTEHIATINLDCDPELVSFSNDASFLVVGDSLGTVHFIHVQSRSIVFSQEILGSTERNEREYPVDEDEEAKRQKAFKVLRFASKKNSESEELLVVLRNHIFFRFSNINMGKLREALERRSTVMAMEVKDAIVIEQVDLGSDSSLPHHGAVHDLVSVFDSRGSNVIVAGKGNVSLSCWRREDLQLDDSAPCKTIMVDGVRRMLNGISVIKVQTTKCGRFLILLDETGKLSLWDRRSLIKLYQYDEIEISDFNIMPALTTATAATPASTITPNLTTASSPSQFSVIVLTVPDPITRYRFIEVISLPEYIVTHHVSVASKCWLVKPQEGLEETVDATYIVEGRGNSPEDESITNLYVRALSETIPLTRFQQLVKKRRYKEAQAFATQFGLDEQIVLKAKLSNILLGMMNEPENKSKMEIDRKNDISVDTLMQDLANIKDDAFCINFCLQAILPTYAATNTLLSYAQRLVQDIDKHEDMNTKSAVVSAVHQAIKRFGTWQLIRFGSEKVYDENGEREDHDDDDYEGFDGNEWQRFRVADMIGEMRRLVGMGKMAMAVVMWRRHRLDENLLRDIQSILDEMPESLPMSSFIPWLRNEVLPHIHKPDERIKLGIWIEARTRITEARERSPHNALQIIRLLDLNVGQEHKTADGLVTGQIFGNGSNSFSPATPACYVDHTIFMAHTAPYSSFGFQNTLSQGEASTLNNQLEDLAYLWDSHDFKISLADYSHGTQNSIALDLLERVAAPELIRDAVEQHFEPYVQRNGLKFDDLLVEYCLEVMDGAASLGTSLSNAPWEARVLAILDCIRGGDARLDVVVELMRRISIPWSESVDVIIRQSVDQLDLRRGDELREQYRLMQLKQMLMRYGIKTFNISDLSLAKGLVYFILAKTDLNTAMDDALQVVNAYHHLNKFDAYVLRLQNLCGAGHCDKALELLHTIEHQEPDSQDGLPSLAFGAAQETLIWLVEAIEDLKDSMEDDTYPEETKQTFARSIDSAVCIATFLLKDGTDAAITEHLYSATEETLNDILGLQSLFSEFGVMLTVQELKSEAVRHHVVRKVIDRLSAAQARENKMDTSTLETTRLLVSEQTTMYRLADILGINRQVLKGIMAEEAVIRGDFRSTLVLCKEMFEKLPDAGTAQVLKRIAFTMSKYAAENPNEVYKSEANKGSFRLTSQIQQLCQEAMVLCEDDLLSECLDDFKNYDIQNTIFAQCESGDYESLVNMSDLAIDENRFGQPSLSTADTLAPSIGSFPSMVAVNSIPAPRVLLQDSDRVMADKYAASLFEDHYYETGLVMDTENAMVSVGNFVLECARQRLTDEPEDSLSTTKSKSKSTINNPSFHYSVRTLGEYLRQNRTFQAAMRVFQRGQEHSLRVMKDRSFDVDVHHYHDVLQVCIQKVLSPRCIDQALALGYMISLPMERAFNSFRAGLSTVGSDYNRLVKFASIGIGCAILWKQRTFLKDCQQIAANGRWWQQLKLFEIPFDETQYRDCKDGEYQRKMVPLLLMKTGFDIITVLEFGQAYNIQSDHILLEYVKRLLLTDTVDNYQNRISGVIDDINNREKLLTLLAEVCVPRISPYDYERLQFVFNQILKIDSENSSARKGNIVLDILSNYTRINAPGIDELVEARKVVDGIEVSIKPTDLENVRKKFPKCMRRLPYHPIIEAPWTILRPELVEESIPRLLPLTLPLDMHTDKLYVTVVDNLMTHMKAPVDNAHQQKSSGQEDLASSSIACSKIKFTDFKGLILKIRDIEIGISIAKYVADAFPCGIDKIQALRTAVHIAEKWHQKISTGDLDESADYQVTLERASVALGRLRDILARTETEHQLHSHNLVEFADLTPQWPELICQLYFQRSEKALVNNDAINLHAITNDIAKRHGLDIEKIRQYLVKTWLTQQLELDMEEREACLPSMRLQITNTAKPKQEMSLQMKVLYLLRYGPLDKNIKLLLEFAYQPSQKYTTLTRIRALSVLFQLASPEEIGRVQKYQEARSYMQMLLYLADFEELKIQQTLKEFIGCNKDALARSLWVSHSDEPKVVELICNLCVDYRIYDLTLWENMLGRLLHFNVYKYLLSILEYVGSVPELAQMKGLPRLWNSVLLGWLRQTKENGQVEDILKNPKYAPVFLLIEKCPFLSELDVDAFANVFEDMLSGGRDEGGRLRQPEKVLVALSVLPTSSRRMRERTRAVVNACTSDHTLRALDLLVAEIQGAMTAPSSANVEFSGIFECGISRPFVLSLLYNHIDQTRCYDILIGTRHLADLVLYLARRDRLDRIVTTTAKMGKWQDVRGLVGVYYRVRGTKRKLEENEEEEKDLVRRYVRQRGLEGQVVLPEVEGSKSAQD